MAEGILIIIKNRNPHYFHKLKPLQKYLGDGWVTNHQGTLDQIGADSAAFVMGIQ